jgi:hypothetical protein
MMSCSRRAAIGRRGEFCLILWPIFAKKMIFVLDKAANKVYNQEDIGLGGDSAGR